MPKPPANRAKSCTRSTLGSPTLKRRRPRWPAADAALPAPTLPLDTSTVDAQLARLNGPVTAFEPRVALRLIGYDTRDLPAAIRAFKLHFIQQQVSAPLSEADHRILYNLYKKCL